jgi:hypothetical protein
VTAVSAGSRARSPHPRSRSWFAPPYLLSEKPGDQPGDRGTVHHQKRRQSEPPCRQSSCDDGWALNHRSSPLLARPGGAPSSVKADHMSGAGGFPEVEPCAISARR